MEFLGLSTLKSKLGVLLFLLFLSVLASGQALTPAEVKNPVMRALQERYFQQLQSAGEEIRAHVFPFPFYCSRVLDLQQAQQERADQRSIRFDSYQGKTVIEVTGNYFASYPADIDKNHRALSTFQDVVLPILQIIVPELQDVPEADGFAMEVSHQVRGKALGTTREHAENFVMILNHDAAVRLVKARTDRDRQAALLEGQTFLNAEHFTLYLSDAAAQAAGDDPKGASGARKQTPRPWWQARESDPAPPLRSSARPAPEADAPPTPARDTSKEALAKVQASVQESADKILKELEAQAEFVSYAPPTVVAFRKGAYLEFSLNSKLPVNATGSRYKLAALAFDDHVAHLIRPIMAHFQGNDVEIDGIGFSTNLHASSVPAAGAKAGVSEATEAVEFFLPMESLRCYESFDCTGQQLINAGAVLINGERVSLDLQTAEADPH